MGNQWELDASLPWATAHVIRLRGPWEYRALRRFVPTTDGTIREVVDDLPGPGRIKMPADWGATLGADFAGRVLYARRFHRPTGLGEADQVVLVIESVDLQADVSLNGRTLGHVRLGQGPGEFDITSHLADANLLEVLVESRRANDNAVRHDREGLAGGLIGEVRLEIRAVPGSS